MRSDAPENTNQACRRCGRRPSANTYREDAQRSLGLASQQRPGQECDGRVSDQNIIRCSTLSSSTKRRKSAAPTCMPIITSSTQASALWMSPIACPTVDPVDASAGNGNALKSVRAQPRDDALAQPSTGTATSVA